jgi:hypothetical protein
VLSLHYLSVELGTVSIQHSLTQHSTLDARHYLVIVRVRRLVTNW